MEFLINPNVTYLLINVAVMLLMLTFNEPKFTWSKVGMVLCFLGAGIELVYLKGNPWAFLVVALSPLTFSIAIRRTPVHPLLLLLVVLMLTIGSFFLLIDQHGRPVVNYGLAGLVALLCGALLRASTGWNRNAQGARLSDDPDSLVGLIGEVRTDIEAHSVGSVLVEGELWQARSKKPISAGATVRILRQDESWLTVKEVEKLTKK